MENTKVLKFLFMVEKCLNVRRDYLYSSIRKRVFITLLILIDTVTTMYMFVYNYVIFMEKTTPHSIKRFSDLIFNSFYIFQSLLISYYAAGCGGEFKKLLSSLSCSHEFVQCHPSYKNFLSQLKIKTRVTIISFAVIKFIIYVKGAMFAIYYNKQDLAPLTFAFYFFVDNWCEARYSLGILWYYSLISVIKNTLKAANELLYADTERLLESNLDSFAILYRQLLESCNLLKKCFGHQILMSLFIAASHFVSIVHTQLHYVLSKKDYSVILWLNLWFHLFKYGAIFVIIAMSGQGVRNEVTKLNRILAQKCNRFTDQENSKRKNVKDFNKLVSVKPITIELLPAMPVGMYLLPAILSLTVNYIIICSQINHDN